MGYNKPQSEFEEKTGDVLQDIASFMVPGSNQYSLMRNIGIPIVGNLVQEGIKYSGNEKLGQAVKSGIMVALDLISQRKGGAKKYASNLFNQMHESIPKGISINASNLTDRLNTLQKYLSLGGSKPSTVKALDKIKEIKSNINKKGSKKGKIDLDNLLAYRPSINEMIEDLGGFEYMFKPKLKEKIIKNLQGVKDVIIKSSEEYGQKFNPEFLKLSRSANEAWSAYENSNKIAQFLNKHFGQKALGTAVKTVLGISAPVASALTTGVASTAAIGLPLAGAYHGIKILNRI